MKTIIIKLIISLLLAGLFIILSACNEDFLDRKPLDQISEKDYWAFSKDFEIYVNTFYPRAFSSSTVVYNDANSDNEISSRAYSSILAGIRTVPASGGWSYSNIRSVNYLIENIDPEKMEEDFESYKQYIGEAYFFRAYFYFNLVKNYGDVPYITKVLGMECEELYASRTPRQQVIDSIIVDLDKAIEYMNSGHQIDGMRLNKEIAQLFKSRVCLYEGTWEKYHDGTVFGVSNPKIAYYLELAGNAALAVINSDNYHIYTTDNPAQAYYNLFNKINYSGNPEVMLWEKFGDELDKRTFRLETRRRGNNQGITKSLIDDYLCSDGLPTAISERYQGDSTLMDVMANRDPRLNSTVFEVGDPIEIRNQDTVWVFERSNLPYSGYNNCATGYQIKKGFLPDPEQLYSLNSVLGAIIFRYAEVLLNYVEAKAELGTIVQTDIDMTINKLRDRVGIPHLDINNIPNDPNWLFPNLSPIINEIRRERRVELALENLRWDDLCRWRAHELFRGIRPLGIRFDPNMYPELVPGDNILINSEGYVDVFQLSLPGGYGFIPDRDYLYPISTSELTLNQNLEQNPGW